MKDHHKMRAWFPMEEELKEFELAMVYRGDDGEQYISNSENPLYRAEIELCTGQKDKNGKLIYKETDIVNMCGYVGVFKWNEKELCLKFHYTDERGKTESYGDEINRPYLEIIGNIHENPELLEESCNQKTKE